MGYIVAADTGGTFTDLVAYNPDSGDLVYTKSLTNYGDLVEGVMETVGKAALDLRDTDVVKFGTTLVINTFVQRNGARAALVTTRGFRDVIEIGRGNRPRPFDLRYRRDPVLIGRDLRFEVTERIAADGSVLAPLDRDGIDELAGRLSALDVEAVGICLLNSYANPVHEAEAAAMLRERLPGVYVTASTELTREWYEFERGSTAAANAYVGPRMQSYLARLEKRLAQEGFSKSFFMMASNGGVFSLERAQRQPVMLLESGPVGGCIGASVYAAELGVPKMIAFDMGGTTAKCVVLEDGRFEVKSPYYVGGEDHGFPIRGAVLDIVEVGAGGGSIAWIDEGRLNVGPRSAGSTPGPVAYGRGGVEPTITDANLVLGRIDATSFLGGEMTLNVAAARTAIAQTVAAPLAFDGNAGVDEAAEGIIALGTVVMASAIRQVTIERGLDPRDFKLFAFGGGGPLHSATLARELNIPEVIIPPEPGNFSALGMLLADARIDETLTFVRDFGEEAIAEMESVFARWEGDNRATFERETGSGEVAFQRSVEMRYHGQKQATRIEIEAGGNRGSLREAFNAGYLRRYGHVDTHAPVEFVGLVLTAAVGLDRPRLDQLRPKPIVGAVIEPRQRKVHFPGLGWVDAPVYSRRALPAGFAASGPAIIEEYGSTTVVLPKDRFRVGDLGEITIAIDSGETLE